MMRRDAEAATFHAEAYAVASKVWGADHPNAVRFEINLAVKHGALNDCTTAMREATHARKVLTGVLPASSGEHLLIDELMGSCYGIRHESEAALHEHAIRQDALRSAGGDHTVEMAASWVDVGDVELDRKRYDDALRDYTLSVTMYEQLVGRDDPRLALPLTRVGEAELALDHRDLAISALERAMWLYQSAVPVVAADARFPLARALWPNPKTRARADLLLATARAAFAAGGAQFATRVAEIDAWSHAHP
jgi:tetratricopeptide (TPR) repeat protein